MADGDNILGTNVPNRLLSAHRVQHMDVRTHQASRMFAFELCDLIFCASPAPMAAPAFLHNHTGTVGQVFQHTKTCRKVVFASQRSRWLSHRPGPGIDCRDKNTGALFVTGWNPVVWSRPKGGPHSRLVQERTNLLSIQRNIRVVRSNEWLSSAPPDSFTSITTETSARRAPRFTATTVPAAGDVNRTAFAFRSSKRG